MEVKTHDYLYINRKSVQRTMKIKEMSQKSRLSEHTLRYYEKIGLLNVNKDKSGHREYTETDLLWLEFIHRLKVTGMPLKDIIRYSDLRREGDCTIQKRLKLLTAHESRVKNTIAEWEHNLTVLQEKIEFYKTLK